MGVSPPPPSMSRAACLALSTSGWSNGLIPISRPATTVAYSQSSICAPSGASTAAPHPEAGSASMCTPVPIVTSTSSGVLGSKLGASRTGTTTGRMPWPSLPVDSAISCSAQSPKPGMPEPLSARTTLSTPCRVGHPEQGAQAQAGIVGVVGLESRLDRLGLVEQPTDVGAGEPARHQPERGQRGVAAADVGVGVEDAVAGLGRRLVEGGAGVGDDDDVGGRLEVGVAEGLLVGALLAVGLDRARRTCWTPRRRCARAPR